MHGTVSVSVKNNVTLTTDVPQEVMGVIVGVWKVGAGGVSNGVGLRPTGMKGEGCVHVSVTVTV